MPKNGKQCRGRRNRVLSREDLNSLKGGSKGVSECVERDEEGEENRPLMGEV